MCRIFGYFDAQLTPHQVRTVSLLQVHGGPDAQSSVSGPSWGMGSNRLAIMDLAGGAQPYSELDGRILAVFNGEIYNHNELRAALRSRGHRFRDACDGSIIPALYLEYGEDFAAHLSGMFSVAVLDLRAAPVMVLATDNMGMKSLYYHWDAVSRGFCFSSEIPALLSFPDISTEAWLPGLDEYLTTKAIFGEQTAFAAIRVLPPATTAVFDRAGGLRLRCRDVPPGSPAAATLADAAGTVRETLAQEVGRLLAADVPISAITSGGLDSSLVTALAAERAGGPLATFNIAYTGEWPADEREFAREVAQRCGTRHHQVLADPADFPSLLPEVVWHLGQPNADPITMSSYALFQAVHDAGFKVTLTGDAADELFGGYDRVRAAVGAAPGAPWLDAYVESLAAVPAGLRRRLYTADYRDYVASRGSARERIVMTLAAAGPDRLAALSAFEAGQRLPAYHLRRVDHLSMAHSVEARLPFCQPPVVALAQALPAAHKVAGGRGKQVLYAAAAPHLPASVLTRPKQPFTLPVAAMLAPGQPLMSFARDVLASAALRRAGLLDPGAVDALLARQASAPSAQAAAAVWALMIYSLWLDQFGAVVQPALATRSEVGA
jgi:asparagine synthase (glutamine-hydrolysing)